ncbi:MAG: hypothetical protein ACRYG8_03410 [Janthinobacterium lividum]
MYLRTLQLARAGLARDADTGGAGGNPAPAVVVPVVPAAPRSSVPEVYTAEFVRAALAERDALKASVAKTEAKASEAKAAADKVADEARAASEKAVRDAEANVTKAAKALDDRLIRAEVRATAVAAGLAHLDFVKLVDTSAWKVDADGEVAVPEGFWAKVKADLPHLFAATGADRGTTSQTKAPPKPADPNRKSAKDMTAAEFKAAMGRIANGQLG